MPPREKAVLMGKPEQRATAWLKPAHALIALTVLALAGCSHDAKASDLEPPVIVWEDGEPTGEFWDSEWANAYLEAEIQMSAARAYADFSDPDLIAAFGYDNAWATAESSRDRRFGDENNVNATYGPDARWAYYGAILDIVESPDGSSATVYACHAGHEILDIVPMNGDWTFTKDADGTHFESYTNGGRDEECRNTKIWIGAWAEPIDLFDVGRDTVKMPLPRQYYIDLGVITQ